MKSSLTDLLHKLPSEDDEGWYFELRKQRSIKGQQDQWVCAKTNWRTNKEAFNNIGATPEEAITKILKRLGQ